MRDAVEVLGLGSGFVGCVLGFVTLHISTWRESSDFDNVIITSKTFENLWMSCAEDSTGAWSCWYFQSLLALPGYIQVCRALVIGSVVLGVLGLICTLVGMQCSKVGGENYVLKGRIAAVGGVFFILQGVCTMIAVSWYASNITRDFFNPLYPGTKYEIGTGLFIGWSSASLALIGGSCLLCSCKVENKKKQLPVQYQTPSRGPAFTHSPVSNTHSPVSNTHSPVSNTHSPVSNTHSGQYGRNAYV